MTIHWNKDKIIKLLDENDLAVERAVLRIYERQTNDEQNISDTKYNNGVGFMTCHARRLSKQAKWILSGKHLTGCHLEYARMAMKKYTRQLLEIIK